MMTGKGKVLSTIVVLLGAVSCGHDSNSMTGPASAAPMASVAGTWSGTYASNSPSCPATPMTVTLAQNGATVTGAWNTNACGPHGSFKATVSGNQLTGNIDMGGCTGGGVLGQINGNALSLAIGDFYRPLVTENQVLMEGGSATLSR
jgi:hypothetical protein